MTTVPIEYCYDLVPHGTTLETTGSIVIDTPVIDGVIDFTAGEKLAIETIKNNLIVTIVDHNREP